MSEGGTSREAEATSAPGAPAPDGSTGAGEPTATGPAQFPGEQDGPKGPEPTRFGDWEKGGRCTDF